MKYKYTDNTLLHSVGFNLQRFESILKNGILSKNEAEKRGISFSRNYFGYNSDDDISFTRFLYINPNVDLSSYNLYLRQGIGFIVEDVDFEFDVSHQNIHRSDEVIVKNRVGKEKIKGICLPSSYMDTSLDKLPVFSYEITSYNYLKSICDTYVNYLKEYKHNIDAYEYKDLFFNLKLTSEAIRSLKENNIKEDDIDYKEAVFYYDELMQELNGFLQIETFNCFSKVLGRPATLYDTLSFIAQKYSDIDIYNIPYENSETKAR